MSIRKRKKKINILPLFLAFQMFLPSHIVAETDAARERQVFAGGAQALNVLNQVGQQFIQSQQMRMQQQQAQQRAAQLRRDLSVKRVDPNQVPPILSQNGCVVLGARSDQLSIGLTCEGRLHPALFDQGHYDALMTVAEENKNTLENFLTEGHERFTTQGVGCYQKARNQLVTQLKAREEKLTQMRASLARFISERFAQYSEMEKQVKEIKKGQALLDGPKGQDAETQALMKDFNFADKFSDEKCKSLLSDFGKEGQDGGFRQIEKALAENKDNLGAETFFAKKNQIEREIRTIATEAYKQATELGKTPQAQDVLGGIRTQEFAPTSQALTQSFGIALNRFEERRSEIEQERGRVVGNNERFAELAQRVQSGKVNLDTELNKYKKDVTTRCFNNLMTENFDSIKGFTNRFRVEGVSEKAIREADSGFKNYVEDILKDLQNQHFTVEEAMQLIREKQSEGNNSRYQLQTGRTTEFTGASAMNSASAIVSLFGKECLDAFEQDDLGNGHSGSDIVQAMRNYEQKFQQSQKEFAANLQTEILQGLTDCPEDTSTGTGAKTCNPDVMAPNKGAFCVRTANECAANAMGCYDHAKNIVETTRAEQKQIAKNYREQMELLKRDIINEFERERLKFEEESRLVDALFQSGTVYQAPDLEPIDLSTKELTAGIDPSLAIEDPEKYKEKVLKNIDLLETQLVEHRGQLEKAFDEEIAKYERNYEKDLQKWDGIFQQCHAAIGAYQESQETMAKQAAEEANQRNQELSQACRKFDQFRTNPCPSSGNEFGSLAEDIGAIAATSGAASSEIYDILDQCDAANNENGGHQFFDDGSGGASNSNPRLAMGLDQFCGVSESGESPGADFDECERYRTFKGEQDVRECTGSDYANVVGTYASENNIIFCKMGSEIREIPNVATCDEYTPEKSDDWVGAHPDDVISDESYQRKLARHIPTCEFEVTGQSNYRTARSDAQELLDQYKRQAQVNDLRDRAGEVRVAACEGGNNSGPGMPDMFNPGQQRGVAGGFPGMDAIQF